MILDVLQVPDPLLKKPSTPVDPRDPAVLAFIADMWETLQHHNRCVGLAAPQVGKSWQVIVVDASRAEKPGSHHGRLALVNPTLLHRSEDRLFREGCLSIPHYTGNVLRATRVDVEGWDTQGHRHVIKAEGFEAIVFQHELDHLKGLLFLDRVASLETDVFRRKHYS